MTKDGVIFSELSPRPHDTGMVTLISQQLNQFDLHARAILGLPIPHEANLVAMSAKGAASAVILADRDSSDFEFAGLKTHLHWEVMTQWSISGFLESRSRGHIAEWV